MHPEKIQLILCITCLNDISNQSVFVVYELIKCAEFQKVNLAERLRECNCLWFKNSEEFN